jgi:hypothetical protein
MTPPSVAVNTARLVIGGLFLQAGLLKLKSRSSFTGVIRAFGLTPSALAGPIGIALPILELSCAALILGGVTAAGEMLALLLLMVFTIAMGVILLRGQGGIECGCFGSFDRGTVGLPAVLRNLLLLAVLSSDLVSTRGWGAPAGSDFSIRGRPLAAPAAVILAAASLLAVRLLLAMVELKRVSAAASAEPRQGFEPQGQRLVLERGLGGSRY